MSIYDLCLEMDKAYQFESAVRRLYESNYFFIFFPQPLRQLHQIVLSLALVGSPKPSLHELLFLVADSFHYGVTEEC